MKDANSARGTLGHLLRTNKLAMILEMVAVLLPLYLGLIVSYWMGGDQVSLGGALALKGGPIAYLGLALTLVVVWITSRLRGAGGSDFGLKRPKNWLFTVLMGLGVALAVLGAVTLVINPIIQSLPNVPPRDMSAFDILTGNLPNLILNVVAMWFTAAFLEEFLWRGYMLERLIVVLGKRTWFTWTVALVFSAVVFGLPHFYQGPVGVFKTAAIGLVLGLSYLAVGRNLWPLVLAHGLIDTLDFVGHYFGG